MSEKASEKTNKIKKKDKNKSNLVFFRLGSLAMALLLWFYVGMAQISATERIYTVPVELRNLASDLYVAEGNYQVQVRVKGSDRVMEELLTTDIHAYVDLGGLGLGVHEPRVALSSLPDGVQLVAVSPDLLTIEIEQMETRVFELSIIELSSSQPPAPGYQRSAPDTRTKEVEISGPAKYLDEIDLVFVTIALEARTSTYTQHLPVQVVDKDKKVLTQHFTVSPATVEVSVVITSDQPDKTVTIDPTWVGTPAPGYVLTRVIVEPETVKVYGTWSVLSSLLSVSTTPIDITGASQDIDVFVDIVTTAGVSLGEVTRARVILRIEPIGEKTFENLAVIPRFLPVSPEIEVEFGHALLTSVTISGAATVVALIRAEDIQVYLDLYGLPPGEHIVDLRIILPANKDISFVSATPQSITVTIKVPEPPDPGGEEDAP
ncbi:MAG: CdaR family protein [Clostridiales bacterium]|nr:CdaR family protein [Clostridiales bacterium]